MSKIKTILSIIFIFTIWGCVSSAYPILLWWSRECVLYLIIIIKPEVWIINHCLGLGHETMVCAVCLTMFLSVRQTDQQVVSSQSGCQAVTESCETASDHSYVMTNNQVTSDNRHENLMKSLFAGSVFQSNSAPVFNLSGNFHFHWINTCIHCNFHSPLYMVHFGEWQSCK